RLTASVEVVRQERIRAEIDQACRRLEQAELPHPPLSPIGPAATTGDDSFALCVSGWRDDERQRGKDRRRPEGERHLPASAGQGQDKGYGERCAEQLSHQEAARPH